jgi:hypothetical protein
MAEEKRPPEHVHGKLHTLLRMFADVVCNELHDGYALEDLEGNHFSN